MSVSLDQILDQTRRGLPDLKARRPQLERAAADAGRPVPFAAVLRGENLALIAEVKRRSPSAGTIKESIDPVHQAAMYVAGGAAAISVLTDGPFFGGSLVDLSSVVGHVGAPGAKRRVPVLRKDFVLSEEQLLESRAAGASAALLIVRALGRDRLRQLLQFAQTTGLETLVEVHDRTELNIALEAEAPVVGVNSRDLSSFRIDVAAAWALFQVIPSGTVAVAESGMASVADVEAAASSGADAVLIGTALSAAAEPNVLAAALSGVKRRGR